MTKLANNSLFVVLVVFFIIVFQYSWEFSEQQQEKRQEELTNETSSNIKNIRFIHYLDENVALEEIKSGNLDTYFFRIPLDLVSDIKNDVNINLFDKIGGSFGILLNPAPSSNNDTINPFEFRDVRFAINYLINR
ncbi:MAG TPA: hypothetical protein VE595_01165, partial [Nitrososphaeraceae archaeon]|nr:hypothetical protein [Nitrososphaeraceae archaeon]